MPDAFLYSQARLVRILSWYELKSNSLLRSMKWFGQLQKSSPAHPRLSEIFLHRWEAVISLRTSIRVMSIWGMILSITRDIRPLAPFDSFFCCSRLWGFLANREEKYYHSSSSHRYANRTISTFLLIKLIFSSSDRAWHFFNDGSSPSIPASLLTVPVGQNFWRWLVPFLA